jgi:feruloyl esterase
MYHCSGRPGPNTFDALGALEQWVELGQAPEAIIATKYANDAKDQGAVRTMPLCSFPKQAHYAGKGDINRADSWSCTENDDLLRVGEAGIRAGLQPTSKK